MPDRRAILEEIATIAADLLDRLKLYDPEEDGALPFLSEYIGLEDSLDRLAEMEV